MSGQHDFRAYGADVIRKSLEKMLTHAPGVWAAEDIEEVHDMRVASRRLRAALSVFEPAFPCRRYDRFERDVAEVTRSLAEARDLDVMIAAVEKMGEDLKEGDRVGVEEFADGLRRRRQKLQGDVRDSLNRMQDLDLPSRFERIVEEPLEDALDRSLEAHFSAEIALRAGQLRAWEVWIADATRVAELHRMRIAAKRLRYTMELFAPFRDKEFADAVLRIKVIQEQLGEIHDADVLVPALVQHARAGLKFRSRVPGAHEVNLDSAKGILEVCRKKQAERARRYEQFLSGWRKTMGNGFFDRLRDMTRESGSIRVDREGDNGEQ